MSSSQNAIWSVLEEDTYLDFLVAHAHEAGDGGNFKKSVFERGLVVVKPHYKRGAQKTAKMLQNKYQSWRRTHRIIKALQLVSGWTWSDEDGCCITPDTAPSWEAYVLHHPEAKPFRNKGWRLLRKFEQISPSTMPAGRNVYHASQADSHADSDEDADDLPAYSSAQVALTPSFASLNAQSPPGSPSPFSAQEGSLPSDVQSSGPPHSSQPLSNSLLPASSNSQPQSGAPSAPGRRSRSGAAALEDVAASVSKFGTDLAAALAPPPSALMEAMKLFLKNEKDTLSSTDFITMTDIFRRDPSACETYLVFAEDEVLRASWIQVQLITAA